MKGLLRSRPGRVTAVALAAALGLPVPIVVAVSTAAAQNEPVQVWLTDTSGSTLGPALLAQQANATFGSISSQSPQMNVDPTTTYQSIDGFGGAFTDATAWDIYNSPQRNTIMNDFFASSGASMGFVRVPMGASDLSRNEYSYDDMPSGQTDPNLTNFSISHDTAYIIPLLQQALSLNPSLKLLAAPWSAPAWMKIGDTFTGNCSGTNNYLNPTYYSAYAQYFVKFIQAYKSYGLPIYMVSMQNEPQNCNSGYATMNLDATGPNPNEAALAPILRSALNNAGFSSVKIMGYDHNWYGPDGNPTTYPQTLMANTPSGDVNAIGYHCYVSPVGAYTVQTTFHNAYPNTPVYFTECAGGLWATNQASNLVYETREDVIGPMRNWAMGSDYWTMGTDQNNGPNVGGGCTNCRGMVTVNTSNGTFTLNEDYYAWAQFSKFVQPGAVRIDSTDLLSSGVPNVAFKNPDGSLVLGVLNTGSGSAPFQVTWNGEGFNYTLPGSSLVTFKWTPGGTGTTTTTAATTTTTTASGANCSASVSGTALSRSGWTASTNTAASGSDVASNAIDGNLSTRFSSDAAQASGMDWEANMGSPQTFNELQMQVPNSSGDYARQFNVEVSNNGSSWTTVASCTGTGDPEIVSFPAQTAQYVEVVLTGNGGGTGSWWSIDELNLYGSGGGGTTTTAATTTTTKATTTTTAATTTTTAPSGINSSDWYQVINQNSHSCVDASGWGTANGTAVQQWACGSPAQTNQEWQFQPTSSGYYDVLNRNAASQDEVWDVTGGAGATASGTPIQTWQYGGGTNQQWQAVSLGNGYYKFIARNSGLCLDVPGASTSNGVQLQQYTCNGTTAQSWNLAQQP